MFKAGTESGSVVFFEILETEIKYRNVISRQGCNTLLYTINDSSCKLFIYFCKYYHHCITVITSSKTCILISSGKILSICWHEELNLIITGGNEVLVWDVQTSEIVQRISTSANKDTKIWAVAVTE